MDTPEDGGLDAEASFRKASEPGDASGLSGIYGHVESLVRKMSEAVSGNASSPFTMHRDGDVLRICKHDFGAPRVILKIAPYSPPEFMLLLPDSQGKDFDERIYVGRWDAEFERVLKGHIEHHMDRREYLTWQNDQAVSAVSNGNDVSPDVYSLEALEALFRS
jgi:hypothetical protein